MTQQYRIKLRKDQIEFEVESTDRKFVESKIVELKKEFIAEPTNELVNHLREPTGPRKKESLMEFLKKINAKSATDHAVAIAYYLEKVDGIEEISIKHIKTGFRLAKFQHSNASQVLVDAKTRSFLMDGSAPKLYTITQSGVRWVEDRLHASAHNPNEQKTHN